MTRILLKDRLDPSFAAWQAAGFTVFAPVERNGCTGFEPVHDASALSLGGILTDRTVKELFFPQTEPLVRYRIGKQSLETDDVLPDEGRRILFGVRPCDAAGLAIDDPLFSWDYKDPYWIQRREKTVIATIACTETDDFCMCTSVGLTPDNSLGSDILLRPVANGEGWMLEALTERATGAIDALKSLLNEDTADLAPLAPVGRKFDLERVVSWLQSPESFDSPFWREISLRCIGCGSCTYLCPTCHCFDIQDEGDTYAGVRRKNWDSCSFTMFTMHTSGHNPRNSRSSRWRQRIMHKFNYYRGKFDLNSCSGCGRCTRQCPVDMGITETLQEISNLPR